MNTIELFTREDFLELENKLSRIIKLLSTATPANQREWLKSAEVKAILGCSDATLKNYRDAGKLPYSKIGGTYYYALNHVKEMLEVSDHLQSKMNQNGSTSQS